MPSRRAVLRSVTALGVSSLAAGCTGIFGGNSRTGTPTATPGDTEPLRVATAALEQPIARAATLWNGNPLPTDDEYGGTLADDLGSTGPGFAGYFASRHGFSPTEEAMEPPFRVTVASAAPAAAHDALAAGSVGIAGFGAETDARNASEFDVAEFRRQDLFRTGEAIVVSDAVYRDGVRSVSREELLGIYSGRLTNWQSVGGPDREIHLVGTVDVQGGPEIFDQTFLADQPQDGVDEVYGRERRKVAAVSDRDDTLTRIPVRDVESLRAGGTDDYRILRIEVGGEDRGPGGVGYPGTYPIPLFTNGDPGPRERAFLAALSAEALQPRILNGDTDRLFVLPAATVPDY